MADVLERVRSACARVAEQADQVRIDEARLEVFAAELAELSLAPGDDPAHLRLGDPEATLAYVVTLDALNFGSGWFPHLDKRPGLSGYFTIALGLREHFEERGPWSARELVELRAEDCTAVFGQRAGVPEVAELMALFARALGDLGRWLLVEHGGRFEGPLESAGGRAARLVGLLAEMPLYRDVARYGELEVPFYKRAQLTSADLDAALEGKGLGCFRDLDRLTIFADNLVPHVLRREGVLVYAPELAALVDAEVPIRAGAREEVEIRAVAVHAVERCVEFCSRAGRPKTARELDYLLWTRGQRPEVKAHPRHRTRTPYY